LAAVQRRRRRRRRRRKRKRRLGCYLGAGDSQA
jgi:hypothetical protein